MTSKQNYEVAIIGGGPAGCSSALHAAKGGLSTILFEKEKYPREKPCGGALSSRNRPLLGKRALAAINSDIENAVIFGPSYRYFSSQQVEGQFVLRETFDQAMAEDAKDAGVDVLENCRVISIARGTNGDYEITTGKGIFTANYLVLAGGMKTTGFTSQLGFERAFEDDYLAVTVVSETALDTGCLEHPMFKKKTLGIFLGAVPNGYGWCFVKDGFINIGIGVTAKLLKKAKTTPQATYQDFVADLRKKDILPQELKLARAKGFPLPFKRTARRLVSGKALLGGDVAGFVSPLSGEGLYYAIKGGQLAAEAILAHREKGVPLRSYQDKCYKAFAKDLDRYGYFLQKTIYKTKSRMELVVTMARKDSKLAGIFFDMLLGLTSYRSTIVKALARAPHVRL